MTIFKREFTYGHDVEGSLGLIPEFLHGVQEEHLRAATDSSSVAHDVVEHWNGAYEGDAATEFQAVGAYAEGRWGFTARQGNRAGAISGDVCNILQTDGTPRGPVPTFEGEAEDWVKQGVRDGLREFLTEERYNVDDDRVGDLAEVVSYRRAIEAHIMAGAERIVNVYGCSDYAYETFCAVQRAFEGLHLDETLEGSTVTFTVDTEAHTASAELTEDYDDDDNDEEWENDDDDDE